MGYKITKNDSDLVNLLKSINDNLHLIFDYAKEDIMACWEARKIQFNQKTYLNVESFQRIITSILESINEQETYYFPGNPIISRDELNILRYWYIIKTNK